MMETQNISSQPSSHNERPLPPLPPAEYETSPISSEYQSSALPVWQLHLHRDLNTNLTTTNSTHGVNTARELRHRKATSILRNRISMSIVPHRTSSQPTAEFVADEFFRSSKNDMYTLRSTTTLLKSEQCQGFGLSSTTNEIILPRSAKTAQLLPGQSTGNPQEYTSNSHSSPNSPNAFRLFHTPTTVESESQPRAMENREPVIPRWQPDAEVTYCPICHSQFNFFVRKHHCRKCGRVVCNSCSPHRITIPHQYIISPPEVGYTSSSTTAAPSRTLNSAQVTDHGGGERVRLCNPCVPDPNNTPAQSIPELDEYYRRSSRSSQSSHRQSAGTSTLVPNFPIGSKGTSETIEPMAVSDSRHPQQHNYLTQRSRNSRPSNPPYGASHGRRERGFRAGNIGNRSRSSTIGAFSEYNRGAVNNSQSDDLAHNPPIMFQSGHDMRPLPHLPRSSRRQISEDDECWVCHGELPSRNLENYETLRADHVKRCINSAIESTSGSARNSSVFSQTDETATLNNTGSTSTENNYHQRSHNTNSFLVPRKHIGIFSYKATEKDQIDNAECTICLEEFEAGQDMGRLECFCRFHLKCIRGWFEMRPGQCPVHQHDRAY